MGETTTSDAMLARLEAEIAGWKAKAIDLEAENARLRATPSPGTLAPSVPGDDGTGTRRGRSALPGGVLKRRGPLAGAAAPLGAGVARLGASERARAAHDTPSPADETIIQANVLNTTTATTRVQATLGGRSFSPGTPIACSPRTRTVLWGLRRRRAMSTPASAVITLPHPAVPASSAKRNGAPDAASTGFVPASLAVAPPSGTGVYGRAPSIGVRGACTDGGGSGVHGTSTGGFGVLGRSSSGAGVFGDGTAPGGHGVFGRSASGAASPGVIAQPWVGRRSAGQY